jgi:hypothetical protein
MQNKKLSKSRPEVSCCREKKRKKSRKKIFAKIYPIPQQLPKELLKIVIDFLEQSGFNNLLYRGDFNSLRTIIPQHIGKITPRNEPYFISIGTFCHHYNPALYNQLSMLLAHKHLIRITQTERTYVYPMYELNLDPSYQSNIEKNKLEHIDHLIELFKRIGKRVVTLRINPIKIPEPFTIESFHDFFPNVESIICYNDTSLISNISDIFDDIDNFRKNNEKKYCGTKLDFAVKALFKFPNLRKIDISGLNFVDLYIDIDTNINIEELRIDNCSGLNIDFLVPFEKTLVNLSMAGIDDEMLCAVFEKHFSQTLPSYDFFPKLMCLKILEQYNDDFNTMITHLKLKGCICIIVRPKHFKPLSDINHLLKFRPSIPSWNNFMKSHMNDRDYFEYMLYERGKYLDVEKNQNKYNDNDKIIENISNMSNILSDSSCQNDHENKIKTKTKTKIKMIDSDKNKLIIPKKINRKINYNNFKKHKIRAKMQNNFRSRK